MKFTSTVLLYKLVILRFIFFTANTFIMAFLAALAHVDWPTMTPFGKWLIVIGALGNWTTVMMAFIDKSIATAQAGQVLPGTQQTIQPLTEPPSKVAP